MFIVILHTSPSPHFAQISYITRKLSTYISQRLHNLSFGKLIISKNHSDDTNSTKMSRHATPLSVNCNHILDQKQNTEKMAARGAPAVLRTIFGKAATIVQVEDKCC